ncbi:transmembrane protein 220 [Takifugu rubripes]|uniref:Transmembrane protein 220 n=1 Tax=Takifugu rubripes TaxID=31033 RepID=A0A3B5KQ73_TAKRU|nr:transmembrane protein 220 [Takifugu rubripes]
MGDLCQNQRRKFWFAVIWRLCNFCMSVFFSLATYVQINDPDAGLWMVGYGVPAVLAGLVGLNPHVTETLPWRRLSDLHVTLSAAVAAMLAWRLDKERLSEMFHQEEGREFSGLLLTTVWLLLCRHSGRAPVGLLRVLTAVGITVFPFVAWLYFHLNQELRSTWPTHCKTAI